MLRVKNSYMVQRKGKSTKYTWLWLIRRSRRMDALRSCKRNATFDSGYSNIQ